MCYGNGNRVLASTPTADGFFWWPISRDGRRFCQTITTTSIGIGILHVESAVRISKILASMRFTLFVQEARIVS